MPPVPTPLTEEARHLLEQVQQTLAEGEQQLRALGLDPEKVRGFGRHLSADQQAQAEVALRADLESVEQDVAEARARLNAATPNKSRSPRGFV
mgnify:CR=1 FL=1